MLAMMMGAGINMVLDPLFILVFHWGVEGAAWATIISQCIAALWILSFNFRKKAVVHLNPRNIRPSGRTVLDIMGFGSSSSLLQFAMSTIQLLINTSLGWYGAAALGEGGGDIALTGLNINMSINMLFFMPVFGINQGAQPILGFNYGAKKFNRVRKAFLLAITGATAICLAGFTLGQTLPQILVRIFAPRGSEALLDFAPRAMRLMIITMPLNGFTIVGTNFFVVTGRPKTSIFLSMLRQVIALIPCLLIFGKIWGLWGIVAAIPVSDGFAFICTSLMIRKELKKLKVDHAYS
jgi:Na+-driven multidrug efflux pump